MTLCQCEGRAHLPTFTLPVQYRRCNLKLVARMTSASASVLWPRAYATARASVARARVEVAAVPCGLKRTTSCPPADHPEGTPAAARGWPHGCYSGWPRGASGVSFVSRRVACLAFRAPWRRAGPGRARLAPRPSSRRSPHLPAPSLDAPPASLFGPPPAGSSGTATRPAVHGQLNARAGDSGSNGDVRRDLRDLSYRRFTLFRPIAPC